MTDAAAAPVAPRAASTILLLRDGPTGLEVFMVVRHHEIDFAAGALVFPGGRVEATDGELAALLEADGADPGRAGRARRPPDPLVGFKVAAIREAFEECGVLLARPAGENRIVPAERVSALDRNAPFADLLARENLAPATDLIVPFARWITPAFLPKRFDTYFFLALAPPDQALAHDGREAVDSIWIAPRAALSEQSGRFKLLFPTERNLWKLARHADVASALAAALAAPVATVVPERTEVDGGPGLRIALEADYGGEEFTLDEML
jgi:8-oxo-dGTP pyrophosphatase MutT (NUDIX family)